MGTRHLTAVKLDNEYKIAQYGQFDGYPSKAGADILHFLQTMDRRKFEQAVRQCRFISGYEPTYVDIGLGSGVLEAIYNTSEVPFLENSLDFAADSLFCEYAYVIDLDIGTFEVFKGFVREPHTGERFSNFPLKHMYFNSQERVYYPVKHVKSYNLIALPKHENFVEELNNLCFDH